jgi:hypothetical protein
MTGPLSLTRRSRQVRIVAPAAFLGALFISTWATTSPHPAEAARPSPIGHVRYIYRGLTVTPPQKKSDRGKVKEAVYGRYALRTEKKQRASLSFRDGSLLHLNERTDAVLTSPSMTVVRAGEVDEVVTPGTDHVVRTQDAVATAIGTEFLTHVVARTSTFIVVEGVVRVTANHATVSVSTGQQTSVAPNQKPSAPVPTDVGSALSWTDSIPQPAIPPGSNFATHANGGSVVGFSSQLDEQTFAASNVNDGSLDWGWQSATGRSVGESVTVNLGGNPHLVTSVVVDPAATNGQTSDNDLKTFEVRVSTTDLLPASFHTVLTGTAQRLDRLQRFPLPSAVAAQYVQLFVGSNYGGTAVAVAEFEVVSTDPLAARGGPGPAIVGAPAHVAISQAAPDSSLPPITRNTSGTYAIVCDKNAGPGLKGAPNDAITPAICADVLWNCYADGAGNSLGCDVVAGRESATVQGLWIQVQEHNNLVAISYHASPDHFRLLGSNGAIYPSISAVPPPPLIANQPSHVMPSAQIFEGGPVGHSLRGWVRFDLPVVDASYTLQWNDERGSGWVALVQVKVATL